MGILNTWIVKGGTVLGPAPFLIAGIVNVTPDSFFDGGLHGDAASGAEHGRMLADQGAHILDVGGESTRPGAREVDAAQEAGRVLPVIRELAGLARGDREDAGGGPYPVVSVDTYKAEVAGQALEAGASIVNDVSACAFDPGLLDVLAQHKPGYVLMHSPGRPATMQIEPRYEDVVEDILGFFEDKLAMLVKARLPEDRIVLDPGIGFGKTLEHNLDLLKHMGRFSVLGRPLYLGVSNKSLWGGLLDLPVDERSVPTQAATAITASRGVFVHRVHDVRSTARTLAVAKALI